MADRAAIEAVVKGYLAAYEAHDAVGVQNKVMVVERLDIDGDLASCPVSGNGCDHGWKITATSLNELETEFKGSEP